MIRHLLVIVSILFVTPVLRAQTAEDSATGQALFDKGRELMAEGENEQACPILEESQRVDPAPGTQYWLATCYKRVGRLASAWSLFLELSSAERAAGNEERADAARAEADKLKPRLPQLVIQVTAPMEGQKVLRNGKEISSAQFGLEVPVDLGQHEIESTAPGRVPFSKTVTITQEGTTSTLMIPELPTAAGQPAAPGSRELAAPDEQAAAPGSTDPAVPDEQAAAPGSTDLAAPDEQPGVQALLSAELDLSVGVALFDYYGYELQSGLASVGPRVRGGVVLSNGLTFSGRVQFSHTQVFGDLEGDINHWGMGASGGYTGRVRGSNHIHLLLGGVGFEHYPTSGTAHPSLDFSYTYSLGGFSMGTGLHMVIAPFETDVLLGFRLGYTNLF